MRAIHKQGTGGYGLRQAHENPPQTPQSATSRWSSFNHKPAVMSALLDEQYQLCCYSEIRADQDGLGYHCEHVENKSQNPQRTFDYTNLAASALHSDNFSKLKKGEAFAGHAVGKQQTCDLTQFISCHQPDCARFFAYLSDGRVVPSQTLNTLETSRAKYTIDTLNLNSPYLVTGRRRWWDELDALFEEHLDKKWSLPHLAAVSLVPAADGLNPFFSLTRQFFGQCAELALQEHTPTLA